MMMETDTVKSKASYFAKSYSSDFEETDSHHEKCKEFEKDIGQPNIFYDENKDLVMLVKLYRGRTNRVLDSGMSSVGIQLKDIENKNINDELINFLSQVLNIQATYFTVIPEENPLEKTVKIKGSEITAYNLIDKLVAALEVTAREEPSALHVTDPTDIDDTEEGDSTREFDWRNKKID